MNRKRESEDLPFALWVLFSYLAIVLLITAPSVGTCLLDRDAADWVIELHRFILKISLTGVVFTVISAILFPFVFVILDRVRPSILLKVMDYALVCMFGCALSIALCATESQFEANRQPKGYYAATLRKATESAEESARNSSYGNVIWGQLIGLQIEGAALVCAENFVDRIGNYLMPGILLPPMFLYIWKRRKNK